MTTFVNLYGLLGVPEGAAPDEIRAAITKQRRLWIKRQTSPEPDRRTEAETRVRELDRAEKILLDVSARAAYDQQLATNRPSATDSPPVGGAGNWLDKARAYLDAGNAGAANYAARQAINEEGANDEAWFIRGHSSFLQGNARDAEYELAEAIRLRPDNASYHYSLGEVYAIQEKWSGALAEYEQALRIDPGNPLYRTSQAQVYLHTDRCAEACAIMEEVVRAFPDNETFRFYLAIALHDSALESLAKLPNTPADSGWIIASDAQAKLISRTATRIAGLRCSDPDVNKMAADMREMVADATKMTWNLSGTGAWITGFVVLGLLPLAASGAGTIFGLLFGGLIIWGFVYTRRKPVWRHRQQNPVLVHKGIQ
ncbi:MAG TPA: tetratricopeptide repeat protein [Pseudonocardiaceae bacterium]|jgi:tetratricopeptide (TPR) repeat protein